MKPGERTGQSAWNRSVERPRTPIQRKSICKLISWRINRRWNCTQLHVLDRGFVHRTLFSTLLCCLDYQFPSFIGKNDAKNQNNMNRTAHRGEDEKTGFLVSELLRGFGTKKHVDEKTPSDNFNRPVEAAVYSSLFGSWTITLDLY